MNRWREYATLIKEITIRIGIVLIIIVTRGVSNTISLTKLIEGGAAILAAIRRNHMMDIAGVRFMSPLVKNILRVLVVSYIILTAANSPEEERPWEIIIKSDPWKAHRVPVIRLAAISPIWLTDL